MAAPKKTDPKVDHELADAQLKKQEDAPEDVVKAKIAKKADGYYVELKGKEFRLAPELGMMAALKFNAMTESDEELDLDTIYLLLFSLLAEDEFPRFERHAIIKRADPDELVGVITGSLESFSGRPTEEPSGS